MKNNIYNLIAVVALFTISSSCTDEDLGLVQVNPNGSSSDAYWNSLERVEGTLTSTYTGLLHHGAAAIMEEACRSDIAYPTRRQELSGRNFPWYNHTLTSSNSQLDDEWNALYKIIFRANQVIEALDGLRDDPDTERWTRIMGEARFMRGVAHFYLHTRYNKGEIVIRDFVPKSADEFSKPLSSSNEVVAFVRQDLKYAYDNLAPKSEIIEGAYRASAGAAATLLGTSYLYEEEYDSAIIVFDDIINNVRYNHGYELADADIMFNFTGENNVESIFEINFSTDVNPEADRFDEESFQHRIARETAPPFYPSGAKGGNHQFFPAAWLAYEYANETLDTSDPRNFIDGNLRPVSLRSSAMVALVQDTVTPYYLGNNAAQRISFGQLNFVFFKKYTSHDVTDSESDTANDAFRAGKNVTLHRFADVLLMQAECLLKGEGDVAGALSLINRVRNRWGLRLLGPDSGSGNDFDGVSYNTQTLMDHLMFVERPLELSAEGNSIRAVDLVRWGIMKTRLEDLAQRKYHLTGFEYNDASGVMQTKNASFLVVGPSPNPGTDPDIDFEFVEPAANFIAEEDSYLPIPASEERANNSI